ncbi:MAG TPA: beta-N-acetylhexosaminidase [Desertimonas sp.]|nr:beta-N-acetylhexosaminidase [Desertimonas sp.]
MIGAVGIAAALAATMVAVTTPDGSPATDPALSSAHGIIPAPVAYTALPGETFELKAGSRIVVEAGDPALIAVAERFGEWLRRSTGFELPVGNQSGGSSSDIVVTVAPSDAPSAESYTLRADSAGVRIAAAAPVGLYRALTTLRQMLPVAAEAGTVSPGPWTVTGAEIDDRPRFEYRGTMLDVARHFFGVDDVLRHIDLISLYKVNVLHLHLTDDQGWRLTVSDWPRLTEVGGESDIEGRDGGYYTAADYARIVDYAAEHFIEVVPEIDGPGHASAALIAYPQLSCDGVAPPPYHHGGISEVSLCAGSDSTYGFLGDVFDALAVEPGRYLHIGGDEAAGTPHDDYLQFVPRAAALVVERGRKPVMWHEAAQAALPPGSVVQYWGVGQDEATELARQAVAQGAKLILSPGNHAYLDMKYAEDSPFGLEWAGHVSVSASYAWEPATLVDGVGEASILGVESALWSETTADRAAVEYMVVPRLAGIAEISWSPPVALDWEGYRQRLAAHGPRWDVLGINYFRSPEVPWPA